MYIFSSKVFSCADTRLMRAHRLLHPILKRALTNLLRQVQLRRDGTSNLYQYFFFSFEWNFRDLPKKTRLRAIFGTCARLAPRQFNNLSICVQFVPLSGRSKRGTPTTARQTHQRYSQNLGTFLPIGEGISGVALL